MRARAKKCELLRDLIKQFVSAKLSYLAISQLKIPPTESNKSYNSKQILSYNKNLSKVFVFPKL